MSSIQGLGSGSNWSASGTGAVGGHRHGPRPDMTKAMAPVAEALGMSGDELKTAMQSGKSLNDLAAAKGVSHTDLVAAIKKGLEATTPADTPTGVDLDALSERIAQGPPAHGEGVEGHHHRGGKGGGAGLGELADLVGVDEGKLREGLQAGTSLSDILKSNGVDEKALAGRLLTGVTLDTSA